MTMATRVAARYASRRLFSSGTGKVLGEEEKAVENAYFKITDVVVVAHILNATLVVPELDHHSYGKDDSDFINIFDVDWFIPYLAKHVTIVKRVPGKVMRSMEKLPYTMCVPRKVEPNYYLDQVLPILLRRQCFCEFGCGKVVQLTKFDFTKWFR